MRTIIVLAAAVLILALVGWVTFSFGPGRSSINLETDKVKQDTHDAMESGTELLDDAGQVIDPSDSPAEPAATRGDEGTASPPSEPTPEDQPPTPRDPALVE